MGRQPARLIQWLPSSARVPRRLWEPPKPGPTCRPLPLVLAAGALGASTAAAGSATTAGAASSAAAGAVRSSSAEREVAPSISSSRRVGAAAVRAAAAGGAGVPQRRPAALPLAEGAVQGTRIASGGPGEARSHGKRQRRDQTDASIEVSVWSGAELEWSSALPAPRTSGRMGPRRRWAVTKAAVAKAGVRVLQQTGQILMLQVLGLP